MGGGCWLHKQLKPGRRPFCLKIVELSSECFRIHDILTAVCYNLICGVVDGEWMSVPHTDVAAGVHVTSHGS